MALTALDPTDTHLAALVRLSSHADDVAGALLADNGPSALADPDLVQALTVAGGILRRVESMLVEVTGEASRRSATAVREARLTTRWGCHDVSELVQRATLVAPATAGRWQRAARSVVRDVSPSTGEWLPASLPATREALLEGVIGVDGILAIAAPLADLDRRVSRDAVLDADAALAASARGCGSDSAPPASADLLRLQAAAWSMMLDQDGAEPRESRALRRRGVSLGSPREGLVPIRGELLPEVAAQLQRIFDALCSPRADDSAGGVRFRPEGVDAGDPAGDPLGEQSAGETRADQSAAEMPGDEVWTSGVPIDDRRAPQKRHDALATALFAAAASGELPTVGGAAPTLVVSVREDDLVSGRGWAHAAGTDEPLSVAAARWVACAGVLQRVAMNGEGRILRLGTEERVFNRHQRRAIALRDGGCLTPGCGVPAAWCEVHHVTEHARGGSTHTDNGVLLCWFHHRFLDASGWEIRMNRGVPELRAPGWIDAQRRWRRVTSSKTRLADRIVRRT
ncbi:HNH endonuclease signature motif containing protein [Microbacterium sp. cx-59]|uniref:HNH endonuclease signature motif containing protein n=1 Tax=Microbacterium sp. cx-59 TaxID=2891207 RepID=UPI001E3D2FBA|nr:HNH endonuclease signature motif containing protein [Microbacterium sp. cx-59]MCC4908550.1 HNH endonuclease [Microbacterium sp. cx-59]